jgi:hypothetical protein
MAQDLETLKAKVKELEELLAQKNHTQPVRSKIDKMSSEVVDSNPYRFGKTFLNVYFYIRRKLKSRIQDWEG